jgi:hypothetical protein
MSLIVMTGDDRALKPSAFIAPAIASVLPTNLHGFGGTNIYAGPID